VVGSGPWATKLCHVVSANSDIYKVKQVAARNVDEPLITQANIIWIATRPSVQLSLIENFNFYDKRVILEKPLARSLLEFQNLEMAVQDNLQFIYLSETWRCSNLWIEAKKYRTGTFSIKSVRYGKSEREYMSPLMDWVGHDLSLMNDLNIKPTDFFIETHSVSSPSSQILVPNEEGILINLKYGIGDVSFNYWEITDLTGDVIRIDFAKQSLSRQMMNGEVYPIYQQDPNHHPIIELLDEVESDGTNSINSLLEMYKLFFKSMNES
jgi:predicted dehydrogenase